MQPKGCATKCYCAFPRSYCTAALGVEGGVPELKVLETRPRLEFSRRTALAGPHTLVPDRRTRQQASCPHR
ncbi:hypothetical protein LIA77_06176 [Sarocladium implicatum]|nr:hypothetical protein LIA77_06176 [Sarocladium implicatum]